MNNAQFDMLGMFHTYVADLLRKSYVYLYIYIYIDM